MNCNKYGDNSVVQAPPRVRADDPFIAVSAGHGHSLALRKDGTVACWGHNNDGQAPREGVAGLFVAPQ